MLIPGPFGTNWLDYGSTTNKYTSMYIKGFLDISGGNLILRNNGSILLEGGDISLNGNLSVGGTINGQVSSGIGTGGGTSGTGGGSGSNTSFTQFDYVSGNSINIVYNLSADSITANVISSATESNFNFLYSKHVSIQNEVTTDTTSSRIINGNFMTLQNDLNITLGNIAVKNSVGYSLDYGQTVIIDGEQGTISTDGGNIYTNFGNINAFNGNIFALYDISAGGNFLTTNGDFRTYRGNFYTFWGGLDCSFINTTSDISCVNGNITVTLDHGLKRISIGNTALNTATSSLLDSSVNLYSDGNIVASKNITSYGNKINIGTYPQDISVNIYNNGNIVTNGTVTIYGINKEVGITSYEQQNRITLSSLGIDASINIYTDGSMVTNGNVQIFGRKNASNQDIVNKLCVSSRDRDLSVNLYSNGNIVTNGSIDVSNSFILCRGSNLFIRNNQLKPPGTTFVEITQDGSINMTGKITTISDISGNSLNINRTYVRNFNQTFNPDGTTNLPSRYIFEDFLNGNIICTGKISANVFCASGNINVQNTNSSSRVYISNDGSISTYYNDAKIFELTQQYADMSLNGNIRSNGSIISTNDISCGRNVITKNLYVYNSNSSANNKFDSDGITINYGNVTCNAGRFIFNSPSTGIKVDSGGISVTSGGISVTGGGVTVGAGGITVNSGGGSTSLQATTVAGGLTVSSGSTSLQATTVTGGLTVNSGLTVSSGSTSLQTTTIASGLTVSSGSTSLQAVTNSGVLTNTGGISGAGSISTSGGLTVSSGSTSLQATTVAGVLTNTGGISGAGNISTTGDMTANKYYATSDYRIKDDIKKLSNDIVIDALNPVSYLKHGSLMEEFGFLAHEVQEVFPSLVSGVKDGPELQTLNYIGIIPILVKEIQDLKVKSNNYLREIQDLRDEINELKTFIKK